MQEEYRRLSYYEAGECGYADASYAAQESALRSTFKCLLNNLARCRLTGGDLLEIGCGYGYLLDEASRYFDRRVGTDFSPEAAAIARRTGGEVFTGGVEEIPRDRRFDCVLAIQVIEHIYDPVRFVQQLATRAKPGAHIVLATPDIGGVLRKTMGRHWPSFKVPEHVVYFDLSTLSSLMQRAGLNNVRQISYPHAFPLGLIAAKFGFRLPSLLARIKVWVPATTVAAYARVTD
jgi:2-polyprenyl-3-methyl-5-hydroxy-6-metoxy-1,4-benzoquinol methylase